MKKVWEKVEQEVAELMAEKPWFYKKYYDAERIVALAVEGDDSFFAKTPDSSTASYFSDLEYFAINLRILENNPQPANLFMCDQDWILKEFFDLKDVTWVWQCSLLDFNGDLEDV